MNKKFEYFLITLLLFPTLASEQNAQWTYSAEDVIWELNYDSSYSHAKKWTLFLSYTPSKEDKAKKPYFAKHKTKIPNISFYESIDLKSNPIIELKDDGLYKEGIRVCFRAWDNKDDSYWEVLYEVGTKYGKCIENPFIWSRVLEFGKINSLAFDNIEGNIGELTHMKKKLYVDISPFKDHYIHLPTDVALRRVFSKEKYNKMMDFFKSYREVVKTKDLKKIKNFIYEDNYYYRKGYEKNERRDANESFVEAKELVGEERLLEILYRASFFNLYPYSRFENLKDRAVEENILCYIIDPVCIRFKKDDIGFRGFHPSFKLSYQEDELNRRKKYRFKNN